MADFDEIASLARIHATIAHFGDEQAAEVMERMQTPVAELREQERRLAAEQTKPRHQRDRTLSLAYASEYAATQRRLAKERPAIDSLGPKAVSLVEVATPLLASSAVSTDSATPPAPRAAVHPEVPARVEAASIASVDPKEHDVRSLPSYLRTKATPPEAPVIAPPIAPPAIAPMAIAMPVIAPPLVASPLLALGAIDSPATNVDTTLEIRRSELKVEPLPFREPNQADLARLKREMDSVPSLPILPTGTDELPNAGFSSDTDSPEVFIAARAYLTLDQYAMILAQIGINSTLEERIWARFGVFEAPDREEVAALFRAAFEKRPAARTRLGELVRAHRRRLLGQP